MATKDVTLYYFPCSYYSMRVLLALYEKNIQFKERIINLIAGEQNESWFLKINRNGEIPVLELNGEYISESDLIVDVIDHTFPSGSPLVPNLETKIGQEVREFRMLLDNVDISTIMFGVLANRKFCVNELPPSEMVSLDRKGIERYFESCESTLEQKKQSCSPDEVPVFERKLEKIRNKSEAVCNESVISERLDDLERVFDQVEERLEQSKRDAGESQEYWLVGRNFTAADITAIVLMYKLHVIAIAARYFSSEKRTIVHEYYNRLMQRPSVQTSIATDNSATSYLQKQMLKSFGKKALKVAVIVGLVAICFAGFREYSKIHRGLGKV